MVWLRRACVILVMLAAPAAAQPAAGVRVPPAIGAAYARLGKAMATHDAAGVRGVWAEEFAVNSPGNVVLNREQVIAAMNDDLLAYRDFRKHIAFVSEKPDVVIVMGHDTMVPLKGPGAGKRVTRPFTDVWMRREGRWMLIARQATIAAVE